MNSPRPVEQLLCDGLHTIGEKYTDAQQLVTPLAAGPLDPRERDRRLDLMQRTMQEIARLEQKLRPVREQWKALRQSPGLRLRAELQRHETLLARLIEDVQSCEQLLGAERTRMLPVIDAEVRRRDMQRAYQRQR